ncbi:4'-phosphopantetheinyl transferase superfamily protein [Streptomyces bohaiensis]|uniref:4'-phosphopantetheinyl transferase superfamily protein n=1 Tax=Streptomyces bohaiensis TaxID=1431344 RepID=A0ABX1C3K3_9ACTN|nr:4'-phosphopantetheinyl transferase superfamily protein [Streptomyces bohaiensis]
MLARVVPAVCRTAETDDARDTGHLAALPPEEAALVTRFPGRRAGEFAAARACARAALGGLGLPPAVILPGARGAPGWPPGVVGSLTHCAGYRGAAVARQRDLLAVGVDAEPAVRLRPGVLERVCSGDRELHSVRELLTHAPLVPWDKVLFSAKESVYKAWFPLTRRHLGFGDAEVALGQPSDGGAQGAFRARLRGAPGEANGPTVLDGRWALLGRLVATAVCVPAAPGP